MEFVLDVSLDLLGTYSADRRPNCEGDQFRGEKSMLGPFSTGKSGARPPLTVGELQLAEVADAEACTSDPASNAASFLSPRKLSRRLQAEIHEAKGDMEDARVAIHMQQEMIQALENELSNQRSIESQSQAEIIALQNQIDELEAKAIEADAALIRFASDEQRRREDLILAAKTANTEKEQANQACERIEAKVRSLEQKLAHTGLSLYDERGLDGSVQELRNERATLRETTDAALTRAFGGRSSTAAS